MILNYLVLIDTNSLKEDFIVPIFFTKNDLRFYKQNLKIVFS